MFNESFTLLVPMLPNLEFHILHCDEAEEDTLFYIRAQAVSSNSFQRVSEMSPPSVLNALNLTRAIARPPVSRSSSAPSSSLPSWMRSRVVIGNSPSWTVSNLQMKTNKGSSPRTIGRWAVFINSTSAPHFHQNVMESEWNICTAQCKCCAFLLCLPEKDSFCIKTGSTLIARSTDKRLHINCSYSWRLFD